MPQAIFAYHLGMDAEQYAFFRIPKLLITEPYFRRLSTDAKLLYGLMLDRMSLSMRNGWMDDDGHVYIYFTLEEACEQLCCKTDKAVKLFAELDSAKGVGLIRRVKQGLGRPAKIYVLRFMGIEDEPGEDTPKAEPPSCRNPDFGKTEVKSSEKPKSEPRKIRSQDLGKTECNKTDKNNTELNNTDSSIHPGAQPEEVIEGYRKEIRKNIEYDHLRRQHPYDDIDEIADLMLEVLCTQGSFMRIGGKQLYTALGGLTGASVALPQEIADAIGDVGFFASIPLWLVTLLGSLFITVLAFIMILTVYGRFFKIYMYAALSPVALASFAGEGTSHFGKAFLRSYVGVCMEGAVIVLACIIFSAFSSSGTPVVDSSASVVTQVWSYLGEVIFNLLVLVGLVKSADHIAKEMLGL